MVQKNMQETLREKITVYNSYLNVGIVCYSIGIARVLVSESSWTTAGDTICVSNSSETFAHVAHQISIHNGESRKILALYFPPVSSWDMTN